MHLKLGLILWTLFIRLKGGANVVQPFGVVRFTVEKRNFING